MKERGLLPMDGSFLQNVCLDPLLVMTRSMDVAVSSACEHSKTSMFCTGPCESCKMKMMLEREKNKTINGAAANSQSKYSGHCLTIPQLPEHPELHVHWSDEDDTGNSSHELETVIEPVKSSDTNHVTKNQEEVHVKPILKHKPTCVVVVHVDNK